MKKLHLLVLVCIATSSFAQVKVDSIGRVTNGDTLNVSYSSTPTPRGQGSLGEQTTILAYGDYNHGMAIYAKTSASWGPALLVSSKYYYDRQVAIMASASNAQPQSSGRSYGIIASAGNRTSGHNCGVVGNLIGTNYGAAVVGCFDWDIPVINGRYAGYFNGDTYVKGTLTTRNKQFRCG